MENKNEIKDLNELNTFIHDLFLKSKDIHCKSSLKEMANTDIISSINIWKKYWFETFDKMLLSNLKFSDILNKELEKFDIYINKINNNINKFNFTYINQDFNIGIVKQVFENNGLIKFQNAVSTFKLKNFCIGDAVNCDTFECENNSILSVRKCKSIKGYQNSRIEAHDVDFIEVFNKCIVDAYNVKEIIAHDYCIIRADENSKISAEESCIVSTTGLNRVTLIPSIHTFKLGTNE